jgi:hypothetical protein
MINSLYGIHYTSVDSEGVTGGGEMEGRGGQCFSSIELKRRPAYFLSL